VRQQEVARLLALAAAALVVVPVARAAVDLVVAIAFLVEFLSGAQYRPLSALTAAPRREALSVAGAAVDRWMGRSGAPLVLGHGYAPGGKDEPRVQQAAALLARAGFDVAVPTIPGLTRGRLRPDDAAPVVAAIAARPGRARVLGVSVGAGPAFLAAADPAVRDRVGLVLALGGYASARELVRFHLTGEYGWEGTQGRVAPDPSLTRAFIDANAELADPALRDALATGDAAPVNAAMAALPAATHELMARLSPERVASHVRAPIVLVHGRADPAVPYTESLRLRAARPEQTRVVLIGAIGHVEGAPAGWAEIADGLRLLGVVYALVVD
jgi:pimeloyl-ACP methyl ester carboxylesterase